MNVGLVVVFFVVGWVIFIVWMVWYMRVNNVIYWEWMQIIVVIDEVGWFVVLEWQYCFVDYNVYFREKFWGCDVFELYLCQLWEVICIYCGEVV